MNGNHTEFVKQATKEYYRVNFDGLVLNARKREKYDKAIPYSMIIIARKYKTL